jgi:hypothetical protein
MPPKITAYEFVKSETPDLLAKEVTSKIADGWQPFGSVIAVGGPLERRYFQALVKYQEETA